MLHACILDEVQFDIAFPIIACLMAGPNTNLEQVSKYLSFCDVCVCGDIMDFNKVACVCLIFIEFCIFFVFIFFFQYLYVYDKIGRNWFNYNNHLTFQCSIYSNIDKIRIELCYGSDKGTDLLKKHGEQTQGLRLTFVPAIEIDGVSTVILFDFDQWKEIMKKL